MAYTVTNQQLIIDEVSRSSVYSKSEYLRNKVSAFVRDLSLHINYKKISDYPLLYNIIYEIPVKDDTHDVYVLAAQYTIDDDCIKIIRVKFFKK